MGEEEREEGRERDEERNSGDIDHTDGHGTVSDQVQCMFMKIRCAEQKI